MHEPARLRVDPDTPSALREALDAEIAAPLGHDLVAMKAALTTQVSSSSAIAALAPKLLALLAVAGVGAWWLTRPPELAAPPAKTTAVEIAAPEAAPAAPRRSLIPERLPVEATAAAPRPEPAPEPEPDPAPAPIAKAAAPARSAPPAPEPEPEDEASRLAAELALYGEGRDALAAGEHEAAAEAFEQYRTQYPEGSLRAEATLGQLEALHRAERPDRVRDLATHALEDPALAPRRAEVLRVLAEAEVMDGRCEPAADAYRAAREAGAELGDDDVQGALEACERGAMR